MGSRFPFLHLNIEVDKQEDVSHQTAVVVHGGKKKRVFKYVFNHVSKKKKKRGRQQVELERETSMSQRAVVVAATPQQTAAWMSVDWGRSLGLRNLNTPPAAASAPIF